MIEPKQEAIVILKYTVPQFQTLIDVVNSGTIPMSEFNRVREVVDVLNEQARAINLRKVEQEKRSER